MAPLFDTDDIASAKLSPSEWVAYIAPVAVNDRLSGLGKPHYVSLEEAELAPGITKLAIMVYVMRNEPTSWLYDTSRFIPIDRHTFARTISVGNLFTGRVTSFSDELESYVSEAFMDHYKQAMYSPCGIQEVCNSAFSVRGQDFGYADNLRWGPLIELAFGVNCNDVMPALHAMGKDSMWDFVNIVVDCLEDILSRFGSTWRKLQTPIEMPNFNCVYAITEGMGLALNFKLPEKLGSPRVNVDMYLDDVKAGYFDTPVVSQAMPALTFLNGAGKDPSGTTFMNGGRMNYVGLTFASDEPMELQETLRDSKPVWHQLVGGDVHPWFSDEDACNLLSEPVLWWAKKLQELGTNR